MARAILQLGKEAVLPIMACGLRHLLAPCQEAQWLGILRFRGSIKGPISSRFLPVIPPSNVPALGAPGDAFAHPAGLKRTPAFTKLDRRFV